jgi:hypothetical protein
MLIRYKGLLPLPLLEGPSIPACPALGRDRGRQTGMLGMVEIESISSFSLPAAGRKGGVKAMPFSKGSLPSQMTAIVKLWRYLCPTHYPHYFTPSKVLLMGS